jgi:hypothetical protein
MYRALNIIVIIAGVVMAFIGAWGLITSGDASTAELQESQLWISIALLAGGIGLLASGLARILPAVDTRMRD